MRVVKDIPELPQVPSVYAMYGGRDRGRYVAYVGIAKNLKARIVQHLVRRDSSVTTGTSAVQLNPDHVTEVEWWEDSGFVERHVLEAAEMIAFDVLDPALRSRAAPQQRARELYAEKSFREEMQVLFSGAPTGRMMLVTLGDALERIAALEKRVAELEHQSEKKDVS